MVDFEILEIEVDEDEIQDEGPQDYLDRIVKSKVIAAGNKILQESLSLKPFLVADTVVSHKNKTSTPDKIEMMKFDPKIRKRVIYKEEKIK